MKNCFSDIATYAMESISSYKNGYCSKDELNRRLFCKLSNFLSNNNTHSLQTFSKEQGYYYPYSRLSLSTELKSQSTKNEKDIIIEKEENTSVCIDQGCFQIPVEPIQSNLIIGNFFDEKLPSLLNKIDLLDDFPNNNSFENGNVNLSFTGVKKVKKKIYNNSNNTSYSQIVSTRDSSCISDGPYLFINRLKSIGMHNKKKQFDINYKVSESYLSNMNKDYLLVMHQHYDKITSLLEIVGFLHLNTYEYLKLYKSFLFQNGISVNDIYQQLTRKLVFDQKTFSFEEFIKSFNPILHLTQQDGIVKSKFLLNIINTDDREYYDTKDIEMFISFLKCRYVFEKNIIDEIAKNLIQRYILLYYNLEERENINREQFNIKKLNLVLETFYS